MIDIINSCKSFLSNVYKTILWILKFVLYQNFTNYVKYENHINKLVILAGGPSLKEDIEKIDFSNSDVCVLNEFYKSPWFVKLKPNYYVVADPIFFSNEDRIKYFIKDVTWEMNLYIPFVYWKKLKMVNYLSHYVRVTPYHSGDYNGFKSMQKYLYRKGLSMPRAQNVLVATIFNGINMGYKSIHLYGVDHSWTRTLGVNHKNLVCAVDTHFYDNEDQSFAPYWKNTETKDTYKMHELLRDFANMFESYHILRQYADYRKCEILNCTKDSFIDAFERA